MLIKCEYCGEVAVDDSEVQEVCGACGVVVEGTLWEKAKYIPPSNVFFAPFKKYGTKSQQIDKTKASSKYALNALGNLCHVYNIDVMCKAEITELFKQVSSAKKYRYKEDAAIMAACCLFVFQRKTKQSIPISNICCQLQCSRKKFSYHLKILKSWLSSSKNSYFQDINCPQPRSQSQTADETIPEQLESLISSICEKAEEEERSKLIRKTTDLVKLANSCWLLTGRSPKGVVVASAYLCWKSMNPLRKKVSFPEFCSVFDVRSPIAKLRVTELKRFLLKLGEKIPSFCQNYVNKQNLLFHLDTILENSETLRNDLFPEANTRQDFESIEYVSFRFPAKKHERKAPKCPVVYDSDMNASDIEISDSEIDAYIFADKRKLVKLFESRISEKR